MSAPEYRQLVAVHHPQYGTGIKRKNSYLRQWIGCRMAKAVAEAIADLNHQDTPIPTPGTDGHPETLSANQSGARG